jgi:hypothetical protein
MAMKNQRKVAGDRCVSGKFMRVFQSGIPLEKGIAVPEDGIGVKKKEIRRPTRGGTGIELPTPAGSGMDHPACKGEGPQLFGQDRETAIYGTTVTQDELEVYPPLLREGSQKRHQMRSFVEDRNDDGEFGKKGSGIGNHGMVVKRKGEPCGSPLF